MVFVFLFGFFVGGSERARGVVMLWSDGGGDGDGIVVTG